MFITQHVDSWMFSCRHCFYLLKMTSRYLLKMTIVTIVTINLSGSLYLYDDCVDNVGEQFLLMFSEHYIKGAKLKLYCTTPLEYSVTVNIRTPIWDTDNVDITVSVSKSAVTEVDLPETLRMTGTGKGSKSILVTSSDSIILYAADIQINTGDAFLVYPTDSLGTEYIDVIFNQTSSKYVTSLGAVALYDLTVVEIEPPPGGTFSYDGTVYNAGQILTVSLNMYELLQVQSHDLSGTSLTSSRPLAVFSAHNYIQVGTSSSKDFMQTMLPPTNTLSNKYVVFGFPMYTKAEFIRIVNPKDDTSISITSSSSWVKTVSFEKKGSVYDFEVSPNEGAIIEGSKEVIVALISRGRSMSSFGDPRVIIAIPIDQSLTEYTFPIANLTGKKDYTHRVVIVSQSSKISSIHLDNVNITDLGLTWTPLGNLGWSVTFSELDVGVHTLKSEDKTSVFWGYLIGYGSTEEYGAVTGRYIGNTNQSVCSNSLCANGRIRGAMFTQRLTDFVPSWEPIFVLNSSSKALCQAKCLTYDTCVYISTFASNEEQICQLYESKAACSQFQEVIGSRLYVRSTV